jgi:hypothetical protein
MIFEEQISAFLDGALSPAEESDFLHILSVSPEKRELFHSWLGVQSAMAADARSAAVPSKLDAAVFAAAGLATGSAAGGATAGGAAAGVTAGGALGAGSVAGSAAAVAGWWSASKILGALLLGLSLFGAGYFLHDRIATQQKPTATATDLQKSTANALEMQNSTATDGGRDADGQTRGGDAELRTQNGGGDTPVHVVYRNVYVTRIDTVYIRTSETAQRVERIIDTVSIALMQNVHDTRPVQIIEAPHAPAAIRMPGRIEIEVQREHLTTYPYIDFDRLGVDRNQQQFAASAGWIFNQYHTAGVVVGQKSFAMDYYRLNGDSLYLFQQQPALTYGGAFYRLSLPVLSGVTPELTLLLGGADLGPVLGGRLGVQLSPFERFSIVVGANGTLLAYRYKDKLFTSHSLGLSYGIRYRF